LRADVVDALVALGQSEALGALSVRLAQETDPRVQRRLREALRDLGAKEPESTKRLTDEVSSLKTKLTELEAKLGRLESATFPTESDNDPRKTPPSKAAKKTNAKDQPVARRRERGTPVTAVVASKLRRTKQAAAEVTKRSAKSTTKGTKRAAKPAAKPAAKVTKRATKTPRGKAKRR
jgi:predicted nuclease with TOPRIM domain